MHVISSLVMRCWCLAYPCGIECLELEATFQAFAIIAQLPFAFVYQLCGLCCDSAGVFSGRDGEVFCFDHGSSTRGEAPVHSSVPSWTRLGLLEYL